MKAITSADNAHFKRWVRLAESPREVRTQRQTLAEGVHLAEAIDRTGHRVEAVIVRRGAAQSEASRWAERFAAAGVPAFELAAVLYDRLAPVERGTGLLVHIATPDAAQPVAAGDVLLLDGVQDPGNAGALMRVAAAAGVRNVFATAGTVALWSAKVLRGAQGAHFGLRLREDVAVADLCNVTTVPWFGAAAHGGVPLWRADLSAPALGIMVGGEGNGLSAAATQACDTLVTIPLAHGVESLNVATAAAVLLFERCRQIDAARARLLPPA